MSNRNLLIRYQAPAKPRPGSNFGFFSGFLPLFLIALTTEYLASRDIFASDFQSPRTMALGGAGRAGPLLNDAILLNPSFAAFLKERVSAGVTYQTFAPTPATEALGDSTAGTAATGKSYQASLQDGRSPLFEAGISYTHLEGGSMIHFGASRSFIQRMGFGLGAKFIRDNSLERVTGEASLSATGVITSEIQTALVIDNLLQTQESKEQGLYREFAIGAKFNLMGILLFYADPHYTPELPKALGRPFGYEAGAELVMFQDIFLRAGLFKDSKAPSIGTWGDGWGMGAGWLGPKISFDFGFSRVVDPIPSDTWNFGATLYL